MDVIDYLMEAGRRGVIGLVTAALVVGVGAGFLLSRHHGRQSTNPDAPIEWNKVQAVPTRAPDAADVEWQQRANALDDAQTANNADITDRTDPKGVKDPPR